MAAGAATSLPFLVSRYDRDRRPARSRVAILSVGEYSEKLAELLWKGLKLFHLQVAGKSILLKPNLVDYIPGAEINTHPLLVTAAVDCFRRLGVKRVTVAEGPGHQRDTQLVLRALVLHCDINGDSCQHENESCALLEITAQQSLWLQLWRELLCARPGPIVAK